MIDLTINAAAPPNGPSAATDGLILDTTTEGFVADVLEESTRRPVLVDFWAPWCGPCRTLSPIIEKVVREAKGAVRLVKMNIDDHPAIAGQLGIQSIPAVIAFVDRKPVDGFLGAVPESQVKAFIDKLAGPETKTSGIPELMEEAEQALIDGDATRAAEIFSAVRQSDGDNLAAHAGLARAAIALGALDQARKIIADLPAEKQNDPALTAARAALELADQTAALGEAGELQARLAADPADHAARFDLALIANGEGDRAAAADGLLAIIAADRDWNESQARTQLLQFFEVWGFKDPATIAARRRLSSLLFS